MGSKYYGEQKVGSERTGGGGSSSRKGKKNNSSDKPKQPQRGLGVAQLEKIRLHSQMGCGYNYIANPFTNPPIQEEDVRMPQTPNYTSSSFSYTTPTSSSYGFQVAQNLMLGLSDSEVRYGDHLQPTTTSNNTARWNAGNAVLNRPQYYQQPCITKNLIDLEAEELMEKKNKAGGRSSSESMGLGSQNSGSSGSQELDLELRLSL